MLQTPKISVIIPVYQAENTLKRCLDSVLKQSFRDFELLLINDGSTDSSATLCEKYAETHPNTKVFHQDNFGPSAARNKGIDEARGKYITFIDADDWVEENYLTAFFEQGENPENTLVLQGYKREYKSEKEMITVTHKTGNYSAEQFSTLFYDIKLIRWYPFSIGKLYDTEIITKGALRFNEQIKFGEDLIFLLDYIALIDRLIMIDNSAYYYLYGPHSLTRSLHSYESEINRLNIVRRQLMELKVKFKFNEELTDYHKAYLAKYLERAIPTLYIPPHRKIRRERIKALKENKLNGNINLMTYNKPKNKFQRVVLALVAVNQIRLLDFLLNIKFFKKYTSDKKKE